MNEENMIYDFTKIDKVRLFLEEYLTEDSDEKSLNFQQDTRKGSSTVGHGCKCFHFTFVSFW